MGLTLQSQMEVDGFAGFEAKLRREEMSNLVILGSTGFIGSALQRIFPQAIQINRKNIDFILKEGLLEKDLTLINCISNSLDKCETKIHSDNYLTPLEVSEKLNVVKWIQLSSYYSEYRNVYGVDFNYYSKAKDLFSMHLRANSSFQTLDLVLPHIYWPTEKQERFFSACYRAYYENTEMIIASLNQQIPILSREKLIDYISNAVKSNQESIYSRIKVEAETIVYMQELEQVLIEIMGGGLKFKNSLVQERRYFHELDWPSKTSSRAQRIDALRDVVNLYAYFRNA
jgi:nucleoside-diphosphate-sugar epimerase